MELVLGGAVGGRAVGGGGDTLGDRGGGNLGGGCWVTLGYGGGAGADGVGSYCWDGCFQFCKRSRSRLMASICLSRSAVGVSLRVLERNQKAWRRRSS